MCFSLLKSMENVQNIIEQKYDIKNKCFICVKNNKECALIPCGHVTCFKCVKTLKFCPVCGVKVLKAFRIHL